MAKKKFKIDERSFHIGDVVAPKSSGAEMGKIKEVNAHDKSITVEFTQKFNGKESVREKIFSADQIMNRTDINREAGRALLKEVNDNLKAGETINPTQGWEDSHKNGTFTERVGNNIGLVEAHMRELKKEGLVTEVKGGGYAPKNENISADKYAEKIDDPKIEAKIDDLAIKNAKEDLGNGFIAKADSWIMDKTDAKAMGSGWGEFKSIYESITKGSMTYSNQFYQNNSKEFAVLDQIATEILGATVAAAAVTGKWMGQNMARGAYNMAKFTAKKVFGTSKAQEKTNGKQPGLVTKAYQAAKSAYINSANAKEAFSQLQTERSAAQEKAISKSFSFDALVKNELASRTEKSDKLISQGGEKSILQTKEGKEMIDADKASQKKAATLEKRQTTLAKKSEARALDEKNREAAIEKLSPKEKAEIESSRGKTGFDKYESVKREGDPLAKIEVDKKVTQFTQERNEAGKIDKASPAFRTAQRNFMDAQAVRRDGVSMKSVNEFNSKQISANRLTQKDAKQFEDNTLANARELTKAGILKENKAGEFSFTDQKSKEILSKNMGSEYKDLAATNLAEYKKVAPHLELAESKKTPKIEVSKSSTKSEKVATEKAPKMTPKQFSKHASSIKEEYQKELSALTAKFDNKLEEAQKVRPHANDKESEKAVDNAEDKKTEQNIEQKQESRGR